jgi:hypothetical protein
MSGTRRRTVATLLAAGVLALAACAQPTDPGAPTGPTEDAVPPTEDTPTPAPSAPARSWADVTLEPGAVVRGLPVGVEGTMDSPAGAAWAPEEGLLYVVTYGSSSCPTTAEPQAAHDGGTVVVTLVPPPDDEICTMDYAPTTSVVGVPAGADSGEPVTVRLGDGWTVELAPRAGPDQPGPPAWVAAS